MCRCIIGLDGCHIKHECGGILLSAIGRDGNNQLFPIASAVVESECKSSWAWFLHDLIEAISPLEVYWWNLYMIDKSYNYYCFVFDLTFIFDILTLLLNIFFKCMYMGLCRFLIPYCLMQITGFV